MSEQEYVESDEEDETSWLKSWVNERRGFHEETQTVVTSSLENWFAFDTGDGVVTHGVNKCVAIAGNENGIGFVGHIAANRLIPDPAFRSVVFRLLNVGAEEIHIFGLNNELHRAVRAYFIKAGFRIVERHFNYDPSSAFTIKVKNGRLKYYNE